MNKIFLETGKKETSEYVFVKTLLNTLSIPSDSYQIECVGGKDNLSKVTQQLKSNSLDGGKNLILFDADFPSNNGGFSNRFQDISRQLQQYGIISDIFLFPNNKDDGDFETLLEKIIPRKKCNDDFLDCYTQYENCLKTKGFHIPPRKGKLYAYIETMFSIHNLSLRKGISSGQWHFEKIEYWDMQSNELSPLKDFLQKWLPLNQ